MCDSFFPPNLSSLVPNSPTEDNDRAEHKDNRDNLDIRYKRKTEHHDDVAGNSTYTHEQRRRTCIRKLLFKWKRECRDKQLEHAQMSARLNKIGDAVSFTGITLSGVTGIANLVTGPMKERGRLITGIVLGVAGIASGVLMNVYRQLNYGEISRTHAIFSVEYGKVAEDINLHIVLEGSVHQVFASVNEFVKHCQRVKEGLDDRAPPLQ